MLCSGCDEIQWELIWMCNLNGVVVNSRKTWTRVYMLMLSCPLRSVRFHTVLHWNGGCQPTKHHPRGILRWVQVTFGMCRLWINMPLFKWEHLCQCVYALHLKYLVWPMLYVCSDFGAIFQVARRDVTVQTKAMWLSFFWLSDFI